ncbi:MAG: ATP-binding protein [Thermodesulfobacteriota bacterium]
MAERPPFYEELTEIGDLMLETSSLPDVGRSAEPVAALSATARAIVEAVLAFAAEQVAVDVDSGETANPASDNSFWLGNVAGLSLAEKLRDSGLNPHDFFKDYARVKSHFIDRFCRVIQDPVQISSGLIRLDGFLSGLSAGFCQGGLRSVKANLRRRQQEARLYILQEKKRYATVFSQMNEPAFVVDQGLQLIDVNPACERFFGVGRAELIGRTSCELIGQKLCSNCPLEEIISTGGSFSNMEGSVSVPTERGSALVIEKTILMAGTALGNLDNGNKGGIVIFQDITERKKAEEELDEYRNWLEDLVDERTEELLGANEKLQREITERREIEKELIQVTALLKRSNVELEDFAHVASHDLQEPLMLVASFAERLMARYGSAFDERGREYLLRITKGTRKLQNLVGALLQLSKVSTCTASFEPLDMTELVHGVVDDLAEIISHSGARVDIEQLHDLNGDAVQIRQLFQNLISNALKYHRENEVPSVMISSRIIDDVCEITVEDNGIGFSEGDLERIFEPFVRLHGSDIYEGTGMGLTTCKKIVSRHGGEIMARGKPEYGSIFVVHLPLHHKSGQ